MSVYLDPLFFLLLFFAVPFSALSLSVISKKDIEVNLVKYFYGGRKYLTFNCRVVSKLYLSLVSYLDPHSWVTLMSKLMECKLMEKLSNQDTWETNLVVRKLVKQ